MANRDEHTAVGAFVGFLYAAYLCKEKLDNGKILRDQDILRIIFLSFTGSIVGSILPDILEPARHPNHRQSFHSVLAASLIGVFLKNNKSIVQRIFSNLSPVEQEAVYTGLVALGLGYLSHLFLDAQTPKGLKWV